jgi:hypothetical protein
MLKLLILLGFSAAAAFAADVSGTWKLEGNVAGTAFTMDCKLQQDGKKLAGHCKGPDASGDVAGAVDGEGIEWSQNVDYNGMALTLVFKGKLAKDTEMAGSVEVSGNIGDFKALKQ